MEVFLGAALAAGAAARGNRLKAAGEQMCVDKSKIIQRLTIL